MNFYISLCSKDTTYILANFKDGDVIYTDSLSRFHLYRSLSLPVNFIGFRFLFIARNANRIYLFTQHSSIVVLFITLFYKRKVIYKNCYLAPDNIDTEKLDFSFYKTSLIFKYFYKIFSFTLTSHNGYRHFFIDLEQTYLPCTVDLKYLKSFNSPSIIFIDCEALIHLDFERIGKRYNCYLKRHPNKDFNFYESDSSALIEIERFIPAELFFGYDFIIGSDSACMLMKNSLSLSLINKEEASIYKSDYSPFSLVEFYNILKV